MPLFFIIAIGAGAFTLGATAVDATSDSRSRPSPVQQGQAYRTMAECQQAAAAQGLSAGVCQQGS